MMQQVAYGNFRSPSGKLREESRQPIIVAQSSIVRQQRDRHGGELLGDRSQIERSVRRNRTIFFQVGKAITFAVDYLVMIDDEERSARMLRHIHIGKNCIYLDIELVHLS